MNNENNEYNQNNDNKSKNKKNECNSFNQIEKGISQQAQLFSDNYIESNKKELAQNNKINNQIINSDIHGSNLKTSASDNNYNDKTKNDILIENKNLKMENEKLKKDLDLLRDLNKKIIRYKGSVSISPEGKYIYLPEINENNKRKLEEIERREKEINEREKEFNNKINFLEDKENQIEKDKNELLKLKKNFEELSLKNKNSVQNSSLNINQIVKTNPLDLYKSPTLIGLNNIGAQYIMNSTLQCLSQTKGLTNYFLKEKNKQKIINIKLALKTKKDNQLSPIYLELIQKLWQIDGPKSFSPNIFMNTVNNMNPLFKKKEVGDVKDFLLFILEQLHKELKQLNNINSISNDIQIPNQYDRNAAFNYFFNNFTKEGSIISDLFFGFNETTIECLNCKKTFNSKNISNPICYNYEIFNCLVFPLEEVKNTKHNSMKNNNIQINSNILSLMDCFYYNQKSELLTGENKNYCNICKKLFDSIYTSKIFISPNILIIILNRGKGNIYDIKLDLVKL